MSDFTRLPSPSPEYIKWWQQQLQLQAQAKQAAWQAERQMTPGMQQAPPPWSAGFGPMPNPLLTRATIPTVAGTEQGMSGMAGYFMGNPDITSNPQLMHALLGSQPGLANV